MLTEIIGRELGLVSLVENRQLFLQMNTLILSFSFWEPGLSFNKRPANTCICNS